MGERALTVSFAEPKQSEMAPQQGAQDKVLYVGNLPESSTEEKVRELFSTYGEVSTKSLAPVLLLSIPPAASSMSAILEVSGLHGAVCLHI